jgi:hypothetical protein
MEKIVTCTKCRRTFTVTGPYSSAEQIARGFGCPFCRESNDVNWPMVGAARRKSATIGTNSSQNEQRRSGDDQQKATALLRALVAKGKKGDVMHAERLRSLPGMQELSDSLTRSN